MNQGNTKNGMNVFQANLCLLCVTLCWSTEVIIYGCIPEGIPSYAITCLTSFVGGLIIFFCFPKRVIEALKKEKWKMVGYVAILAVLNMVYNLLYIVGLQYFDVTTGAFTISMTVVVLPVIFLTIREHIEMKTWISVILVFTGIMAVVFNDFSGTQAMGLVFMVLGCLFRAIFIVLLNKSAKKYDTIALSSMVAISVGIFSFVPWFISSPGLFAAITWSKEAVATLTIYAYFIVALAQTINIMAQKKSTPANATIIYSMEIVFSTIWGTVLPASLVDSVKLTPYIVVGVILVVLGNIVEIGFLDKILSKLKKRRAAN